MAKDRQILLLLLLVLVSKVSLSARIARQAESSDDKNEIPSHESDEKEQPEGFPDDEEEQPDDELSFRFFVSPFRHLDRVFQQFQDTMRKIYSDMFDQLNQTALLPPDFENTSTQVIQVNGKKYNVSRSVFKKSDNNSEIVIHSLSVLPSNRKKRNA